MEIGKCPVCDRLKSQCRVKRLIYEEIVTRMNAAEDSPDTARYMTLRRSAQEAKIDLQLADAEFLQDQDRHAVPN
jgi:hypothetical protein